LAVHPTTSIQKKIPIKAVMTFLPSEPPYSPHRQAVNDLKGAYALRIKLQGNIAPDASSVPPVSELLPS